MAYPTDPEPNEVHEEKAEYRVTVKRAIDGTRHKRLHQTQQERTWRLVYQYIDETDQGILDDYFDSMKGEYTADTWTTPYNEEVVIAVASFRRISTGAHPLRHYEIVLVEEPQTIVEGGSGS